MTRKLICDFCSSPNVEWCYPTRVFKVVVNPEVGMVSEPNFASCEACHGLIEDGNHEELAIHSATTFVKNNSALLPWVDFTDPAVFAELVKDLRSFHDEFRANRIGDPYPDIPTTQ